MHAAQDMGQPAVEGDPQPEQGELREGMHRHMEDGESGHRPQQGPHHAEEGPFDHHPSGGLGHHPDRHGRPIRVLHMLDRRDGEGHPGR